MTDDSGKAPAQEIAEDATEAANEGDTTTTERESPEPTRQGDDGEATGAGQK